MGAFNKRQEAEVARIESITHKLEDELGLSGFLQIRHIFDAGMDGDTTAPDDAANLFGTTAITTPSWNYRSAQIRWYLPTAALATDDALEQVAIHEYVHILLHPITQLLTADDLSVREEYATESISRMICHARGMEDVH